MPRPRRWSDDDLAAAVARSDTLREVCRQLDISPGARTYEALRRAIRRLKLDASHLPHLEANKPRRTRRFSESELADAVRGSTSMSDVLRAFGYEPSGGMYRYITAEVTRLNLDTTHFRTQPWNKGLRFARGRTMVSLEDALVAGSPFRSSRLRQRLIEAGLKEARCENCGLVEWNGKPIQLELDHINGDPSDNRLVNLRILCPNCHAQTETWCGRNRGRPLRSAG